MLFTKREWSGAQNLPTQGGYVVCPNHYSYVEPLAFGHFLVDHGHSPRYLGKAEVFRAPVVGAIVRHADQIPVYRESGRAADAYRAAVEAVRAGKARRDLPRGHADPRPRPLADARQDRRRPGGARDAVPGHPGGDVGCAGGARPLLASGCACCPARRCKVRAGRPVPLDDLYGREITSEVLHEATARIMAAITAELEVLRGEKAPVVRFDPRTHGVTPIGKPRPLEEAS